MEKDDDLCKKYDLPSLEAFEEEFGTVSIDEHDDALFELISKAKTKIAWYLDVIEDILHPDSGMQSMIEADIFSVKEKQDLFALFCSLTSVIKKRFVVFLNPSEEGKALYLKELISEWEKYKIKLEPYFSRIVSHWQTLKNTDSSVQGYFG